MERHWWNGRKLPFEAQEVTGGRIPLILNVSKTRHPITTSGLRLPARKGAKVEVNGPAYWVHEALAQVILKLNPEQPLDVLACVVSHALSVEEDKDDGTN